MISTSCCVALAPAMEMARSPETLVSMKLSTITVRATSSATMRRRRAKRSIGAKARGDAAARQVASEGCRPAVAPRVAAGHAHAVLQHADRLDAAGAFERRDDFHLMAHRLQRCRR